MKIVKFVYQGNIKKASFIEKDLNWESILTKIRQQFDLDDSLLIKLKYQDPEDSDDIITVTSQTEFLEAISFLHKESSIKFFVETKKSDNSKNEQNINQLLITHSKQIISNINSQLIEEIFEVLYINEQLKSKIKKILANKSIDNEKQISFNSDITKLTSDKFQNLLKCSLLVSEQLEDSNKISEPISYSSENNKPQNQQEIDQNEDSDNKLVQSFSMEDQEEEEEKYTQDEFQQDNKCKVFTHSIYSGDLFSTGQASVSPNNFNNQLTSSYNPNKIQHKIKLAIIDGKPRLISVIDNEYFSNINDNNLSKTVVPNLNQKNSVQNIENKYIVQSYNLNK